MVRRNFRSRSRLPVVTACARTFRIERLVVFGDCNDVKKSRSRRQNTAPAATHVRQRRWSGAASDTCFTCCEATSNSPPKGGAVSANRDRDHQRSGGGVSPAIVASVRANRRPSLGKLPVASGRFPAGQPTLRSGRGSTPPIPLKDVYQIRMLVDPWQNAERRRMVRIASTCGGFR
jgi:hypothetical protein